MKFFITASLPDQAALEDEDVELYELTEFDSIKVEAAYHGTKLTFPMTSSQICTLMASFKNGEVSSKLCSCD